MPNYDDEVVVLTVTNNPVIIQPGTVGFAPVITQEPVEITIDTTPVVVELGGQVGPGGATGPPGAPGGVVSATSGQALSAGRLTTITDLGAFYFDPTDTAQYGKAVGVTGSAVGIGDAIEVQCAGVVSLVGAGFTPGQRFWAGPNGTLLTAPPSSGLVVPVGYAIDADNLFVQIESYLEW